MFRLTELASAAPTGSASSLANDLKQAAGSLFDSNTGAVAKETGRSLSDELFGQVKEGRKPDIRDAAKSAVNAKVAEMKQYAIEKSDDAFRSLLDRVSRQTAFDPVMVYNTFLSPQTSMATPWQAYKHVKEYFEVMVGQPLDRFFGSTKTQSAE